MSTPYVSLNNYSNAIILILNFVTFIHLSAGWAFWPVLIMANIAALIASRTMTTATFSCIKQSAALGCFPRLKIIHTSRKYMGKIYIPVLNWFLLAFSLVLVCSISNIYEIGNAYGNDSFTLVIWPLVQIYWNFDGRLQSIIYNL